MMLLMKVNVLILLKNKNKITVHTLHYLLAMFSEKADGLDYFHFSLKK